MTEGAINDALNYAREAGELLIEAKTGVKHGEWLLWLETNFQGSDRTARKYMQIADRWDELNNHRLKPVGLVTH